MNSIGAGIGRRWGRVCVVLCLTLFLVGFGQPSEAVGVATLELRQLPGETKEVTYRAGLSDNQMVLTGGERGGLQVIDPDVFIVAYSVTPVLLPECRGGFGSATCGIDIRHVAVYGHSGDDLLVLHIPAWPASVHCGPGTDRVVIRLHFPEFLHVDVHPSCEVVEVVDLPE